MIPNCRMKRCSYHSSWPRSLTQSFGNTKLQNEGTQEQNNCQKRNYLLRHNAVEEKWGILNLLYVGYDSTIQRLIDFRYGHISRLWNRSSCRSCTTLRKSKSKIQLSNVQAMASWSPGIHIHTTQHNTTQYKHTHRTHSYKQRGKKPKWRVERSRMGEVARARGSGDGGQGRPAKKGCKKRVGERPMSDQNLQLTGLVPERSRFKRLSSIEPVSTIYSGPDGATQ